MSFDLLSLRMRYGHASVLSLGGDCQEHRQSWAHTIPPVKRFERLTVQPGLLLPASHIQCKWV